MHQLSTMTYSKTTPPRRQRGISLIESLVAIVVTALGILGILGVQMRTLSDTSTTVRRAQAIRLIEDLGERMKVNPNAMVAVDTYIKTDFLSTPTFSASACDTGCKANDLAKFDLAKWVNTVKTTIPNATASIFYAKGEGTTAKDPNRRQLGVMISWRENERDGTKTDAIDATKGSASGGGGDVTCPEGRICHLQYIPVAARCAPYDNGTGTPLFYCS